MSTSPKIPTVKLASGASMPVVGLGTWKAKPGEVKQAIKDAIDIGYRHFDCALVYGNESEIGEAIAEKLKEGAVKREDLFICSKLWCTYHSEEGVQKGIKESLAALQLDYLDLYIIHWPFAYAENRELFPTEKDGKMAYNDVDYIRTWKYMEELQRSGKARDIGISNFNVQQTKHVVENAKVPVSVNQIEGHVYLQSKELWDLCKKNNIQVVTYSPLGSGDRDPKDPNCGVYPPPLEDPVVKKIADRQKKQPGQILLRFLVQQGLVVIPKSVNKKRMQANLELFDFELNKDDVAEIENLDKKGKYRCCLMADDWDHKAHPFPHSGERQKVSS